MKLTVSTLVFNELNDTKGLMANLKHMTTGRYEFLLLDNGSTENVYQFATNYLKPGELNYIRNDENVGTVKGMQQIYENATGDVIAVFHNDVLLYEYGWNERVMRLFEDDPKLGMVALFGAAGCMINGGRVQVREDGGTMAGMSNMLEAEIHGARISEPHAIAIPDGFGMIFRKEMLDKGNGFDQRYSYHHLYDRDIGLESLRRGYHNMVIDIPCHHWSGITANRSNYQDWVNKKYGIAERGDLKAHDDNTKLFNEKWGPEGYNVLPLYVNEDFTFRDSPYTGDRITK